MAQLILLGLVVWLAIEFEIPDRFIRWVDERVGR